MKKSILYMSAILLPTTPVFGVGFPAVPDMPLSGYGMIQNVQHYSSNPNWNPNSPYNMGVPQAVYATGPDLTAGDCPGIVASIINIMCNMQNNCDLLTANDIKADVMVRLSQMPGENYVSSCSGYIDSEFDKYKSNANNLRGGTAFPTTGFGTPDTSNTFEMENPFAPAAAPEWKQEQNQRANELKQLQAGNKIDTELKKKSMPETIADYSFDERIANATAGYEPWKDAQSYYQLNVTPYEPEIKPLAPNEVRTKGENGETIVQYRCDPGMYLMAGQSTSCSECIDANAYYYCPGGLFSINNTADQGKVSCPDADPDKVGWVPIYQLPGTSASACNREFHFDKNTDATTIPHNDKKPAQFCEFGSVIEQAGANPNGTWNNTWLYKEFNCNYNNNGDKTGSKDNKAPDGTIVKNAESETTPQIPEEPELPYGYNDIAKSSYRILVTKSDALPSGTKITKPDKEVHPNFKNHKIFGPQCASLDTSANNEDIVNLAMIELDYPSRLDYFVVGNNLKLNDFELGQWSPYGLLANDKLSIEFIEFDNFDDAFIFAQNFCQTIQKLNIKKRAEARDLDKLCNIDIYVVKPVHDRKNIYYHVLTDPCKVPLPE